jgi:PAS domain S-box-containing protein
VSGPNNTPDADAGRTQTAVFDRRDWLQITLSSIGDGVIAADASGRISYLNPVAEALTGWKIAEAAGKEIEEVFRIINETTRQPVDQPVRKVIELGQTVGLGNHTILIARDGSERPIDDSAAAIKNEQGDVVGVVLIFRDITQRRKAERQIEWAKDYVESIVKTVREPMLVLDEALHVRSANRSFYQTFRVDPAETVGRFIYDLGDGQWNIPALKTLLEEIIPRNSAFDDFEVAHDFERIGRKTMLLNARRFPPEGRHELILLSIEDVTERKQMLHDLTASEVRYRRLFEAAHDGILLLEPDSRKITDANPFMVQLLGYPRAELVGKELWEIGLLGDEQESQEAFRSLRENGSIRYEHLPLRSKGGELREVEFVSNVYHEDSRLVIQCNIRDITERRRMAEERERLFQAAEVARDRALVHEGLLADADRHKDEFLAMLAHELRNPLAAINGAVDLARKPGMESQRGWTDELVKRQVKHLTRLIEDLLDVSRISQGKIHLRKEPVDLHAVVKRAVEIVTPLIAAKDQRLTVSLPPGDMPLEADPTRLEQILVNLLNNATKYTERGGQIELSGRREGEELCITVSDNGVGIEAGMLSRVFELFTQVDDSLDRSRGGLGIGLTLVRRLAELHGGSVTAASEGLGKGSEFTVRLPAACVPSCVVTSPPARAPVAYRPHLRLLVVDDNEDMTGVMAKLLRASGHDVCVAHDGPAAIEIARSQGPEAVLLDIGLPGMNGYQLAARLRREGCCRGALFIAISGYGRAEDLRRSAEAGFDHHLVKPIEIEALLEVLGTPHGAPPVTIE